MSCPKICTGELNKRIEIVSRIKTPADYGKVDALIEIGVVKKVWAKQESKGGIVVFDSANIEAVLTDIFWIKYISGLDITNSIIYNGINYKIIDIENINGDNDILKIKTSKRGDYTINSNLP